MAAAAVDSAMEVVPALAEEAAPEAAGLSCLVNLPGEVLEYILCSGSLTAADIGRVSSTCRRLRELCQSSGKVWKEQFRVRWPSLMKHYSPTDYVNWLEEYKVRQKAGLEARKIVASFSKRFFSEHVPCNGFSDIENLEGPEIFFEDELVCILNMEGRKALTWKYYAKKILYYLRQQKILNNLKAFLQQPDDYESYLEGAVYIDQYCNPLSDISLKDIQAQIDSIVELVCKTLRGINSRHPSLAFKAGESSMIMEIELQSQVLDAMNYVLYDQLKFKGNRMDYYNALNLYMHQVLIRRTGIPISMSLLYLTIARQLGVPLEPVNFPSHFLLRWCQGAEGASLDIFDYIYIDAFGKGKQLTVKECEYLIGQHVTAALYGVVNVKKVLQRMVGNLLSLGKREGIDQSYQLLRDSLDLYLAMYPDQVQLLLLQARLYFHLGIWPEKVLDILQHIQTLDPGQHGAVGYLVQHTLEHIERKKEEVGVEVKLRSHEKHRDVCYSIGLIMKHKSVHCRNHRRLSCSEPDLRFLFCRKGLAFLTASLLMDDLYGYNCVIYGWDPTCMMGHEWIRNMNVHSLPHGHHQPFYNVLVEDGSCRYAAQENLEYNVEPQEISHPDVGRYFSEFTGTHYIPNAELEIRYPEDLESVYETVQNIYSAKKEDVE
ncbi:F-box only protein 21 isoform X2 [Callorhinus ursinus]|uniref:F-box only protein 21 isoform X3 n=1 Tax=Zalophus californianus TaxID=9704 RepID=A0A6J2BNF6_ZALCA|nr:F-box only protein 21 isoform X3 [Zalophus californianus]